MAAGIRARHRKDCKGPQTRGRCCDVTYQADVFDAASGQRTFRTFKTLAAAKTWRSDATTALRRGEVALVSPSGETVGEALDALIAGMEDGTILDRSGRRYRPATIRRYRSAVEHHLTPLAPLALSGVRRGDVQRVVDRLHADGFAGSTIRNVLDPLRVVYRRAIEDEALDRNPAEHLRLPGFKTAAKEIADPERVDALLAALPDDERAAWAVAFYAGLRVGELRALRWDAVDFDAGVIHVRASWDDEEGEQETKTAAGERSVPLVGRVRSELARHKLATGRAGADLVFGRTARDAFVRSTQRSRARAAWKRARLTPLSPHEARHTAASYFAAAGLSPQEAKTAMGHADIRTTMNIYAKAVPGWQGAAAAKLDAYLDAARATVAPQ